MLERQAQRSSQRSALLIQLCGTAATIRTPILRIPIYPLADDQNYNLLFAGPSTIRNFRSAQNI